MAHSTIIARKAIGRALIIAAIITMAWHSETSRDALLWASILYLITMVIGIVEKESGHMLVTDNFRILNIAVDWIWRGFRRSE